MLNREFSFINLFSTEEISLRIRKKIYSINEVPKSTYFVYFSCTLFTNLKIEKGQPLKVIYKPEKVIVFFLLKKTFIQSMWSSPS